ncbi:ras-like GTP-binding protein [Aspergillus campestris IBT 28561]|uniref:Ras-like GTP-binding protein n=1 Tax=Aspergillus campestris (strain IBT 28561) TaxID=1392248 RepID=A0A2I1D767_ASPC2|nr:ras-like GTP-binding protein [Aspergillus campestris IBT 28561]PKY05730.1 ras-like GTP-binding protein [Aspergillus campestris IBT 28561]
MSSSLEAKIVVLGAQGVGKTSLVHRYVKNAFTPTTTPSTVGASFITKRVLDSASDTLVRLQIWDTAGQERFRSISRLYYRGANACLLCYDITNEQSFQEMTGWLVELKRNLDDSDGGAPLVIHVVGTKSDIVALDPTCRRVPFERTIAYVADQLYPSRASTPPPSAGVFSSSASLGMMGSAGTGGGDSKRSSGFWGQDIGWDCCHEISAKDGEGIEEVFRVITRKLVEQQRYRRDMGPGGSGGGSAAGSLGSMGGGADGSAGWGGHLTHGVGSGTSDGHGSFRLGYADKRRTWLGFPPSSVGDEAGEEVEIVKPKGRCC